MSGKYRRILRPFLAICTASGITLAATSVASGATGTGIAPHLRNCQPRSWAVTTSYQNLWRQSPNSVIYTVKNGGAQPVDEGFSWDQGFSADEKWGQTQGTTLGISVLMASLDLTFGGSTTTSFTVDQGQTLDASIYTPPGAWAYFAEGFHAEFGSGAIDTEMSSCQSIQTGSWFGFGFPLWPAEVGICDWTTGASEASCSNSTRATGNG